METETTYNRRILPIGKRRNYRTRTIRDNSDRSVAQTRVYVINAHGQGYAPKEYPVEPAVGPWRVAVVVAAYPCATAAEREIRGIFFVRRNQAIATRGIS
jgi:hypothetical protein